MCVCVYLGAVSSALQAKMIFTQFADDHRVGRVTCGGVSYEDIAAFSRDPVPQNMLLMVGRMLGGEGGGRKVHKKGTSEKSNGSRVRGEGVRRL